MRHRAPVLDAMLTNCAPPVVEDCSSPEVEAMLAKCAPPAVEEVLVLQLTRGGGDVDDAARPGLSTRLHLGLCSVPHVWRSGLDETEGGRAVHLWGEEAWACRGAASTHARHAWELPGVERHAWELAGVKRLQG